MMSSGFANRCLIIMTDDYVLNFRIGWKRPIDLQSPSTSEFFDKLSDAAPTLDRYKEDTEKGKIGLFEEGKLRRLRDFEIKSDSLVAAAGSDLSRDERHEFVRIVATATESLEIVKRDVSLVLLRVIVEIKHWGNHHDLAARALCEPGSFYKTVQQLGMPLVDMTIALRTSPIDRDEFAIGVTVVTQTAEREIRSGDYDGDELGILCDVARTHGFHRAGSFCDMLAELEEIWTRTAAKPIMDNVVESLKRLAVTEKPQDRS